MDSLDNPRFPIPDPPELSDTLMSLNENGVLATYGKLPLYRDETQFSLFNTPDIATEAGEVYLYAQVS